MTVRIEIKNGNPALVIEGGVDLDDPDQILGAAIIVYFADMQDAVRDMSKEKRKEMMLQVATREGLYLL